MSLTADKNPKIVVLTSIFPAVSETFVVDHIVGLERRGWSVTVVALDVGWDKASELAERLGLNFEVRQLPISTFSSRLGRIRFVFKQLWKSGGLRHFFSPWVRDLVLYSEEFEKVCCEVAPNLIHAHFGPNGIIASFVARANHLPLLVNFHGYDVNVVPRNEGWGPYRRFLRGATAIVHSPFVHRILQNNLSMSCQLIPLGVDSTLFCSPNRKKGWNETIQLLVVGRLVYLKGVHIAVEVLSLLQAYCPDFQWELSICGDGPEREAIFAKVTALGLINQVKFYGALEYEEVAMRMVDADILLIPSIPDADGAQEAFSRVAIEGMASGLAVVAFNTGGLLETIGSGGKLVGCGNAKAMAEAVVEMVEMHMPSEWETVALEQASHYSITSMWLKYDQLSRQMLIS